jgi:tetratricopeptide (TPR) repeat protein
VRRSPHLARQWTLYDHDAHDRALQQARTLLPRLHGAARQEAYLLIGLCYERKKDHKEALYWLQRASEGSDNSQVWLELALTALKAGERTLSAQAFEQVRLCQQVARYAQPPGLYLQLFWYAGSLLDPLPRAKALPRQLAGRTTALRHQSQDVAPPEGMAGRSAGGDARAGIDPDIKGRRDQARLLLDELAAVYRRLYLTDTTFLYARRMPFLSSFLTLVKRFFLLQGQLAEGVTWLQEFAQGLDRAGQDQVDFALQALQSAGIQQDREDRESNPT